MPSARKLREEEAARMEAERQTWWQSHVHHWLLQQLARARDLGVLSGIELVDDRGGMVADFHFTDEQIGFKKIIHIYVYASGTTTSIEEGNELKTLLDMVERYRYEAARRQELRQSAIAKLSPDEREALGLT